LNFFGLPIVGDTMYGGAALESDPGAVPDESRFLLHARCLYLKDPIDDSDRSFDAPVPDYFKDFCQKRGLSNAELESILGHRWPHWNTIFHKVGVED
jgi:hypothetical protein